jgi:hypothetical protein
MVSENVFQPEINFPQIAHRRFFFGILTILFLSLTIFAQTELSHPDENTLIIENAPEQEIFAFGKKVIVRQKVKGVMSFGGDVIIEGEVSGEVATVGGSIIQKKNAFIGGDVFVIGGTYQPEIKEPRRNKDKETLVYAGYEEELREFSKNPSQIFSPAFTPGFFALRIFNLLLWFGASFLLTLISPGAISRAISRFKLSTLKIFGIGALAFFVINLGFILSFKFLPQFIAFLFGLIAFIFIILSYVFGRVALQVSVGKWFLKRFSPGKKRSETLGLFIGAFVWTFLLSVPYIWTIALFAIFTASLGLVLTARSTTEKWETE